MFKWEGEHLQNLKTKGIEELKKIYPDKTEKNLRRRKQEVQQTHVSDKVLTPEEESTKDKEIYRLSQANKALKTKYEFEIGRSSGFEALQGILNQIIAERPRVVPPPKVKIDSHATTEHAVLALGDLHFGEVVDIKQTGGIAVFNMEIAKKRLDFTVDRAIEIIKGHLSGGYHIPKIHVFLLGDLISGEIHEELRNSNEQGIIQQTMFVLECLEENILKLCENFEEVHITSVVGNHGRKKEDYYFKDKAVENFDYLISRMLEKYLDKQPNLTWSIPQSYWAIQKVQNRRYLVMHGDGVRSWMGLPFYGLQKEFLKWRALAESYLGGFDDLVVGHFHNPNIFTVQRDEIIINGTIKGGDEYSLGALSAACDPVQFLWGVHPKYGRTWTYKINSSEVKP